MRLGRDSQFLSILWGVIAVLLGTVSVLPASVKGSAAVRDARGSIAFPVVVRDAHVHALSLRSFPVSPLWLVLTDGKKALCAMRWIGLAGRSRLFIGRQGRDISVGASLAQVQSARSPPAA